jgi:hypothetical protein
MTSYHNPLTRLEKINAIIDYYTARDEATCAKDFENIRQRSIDEMYEALPKSKPASDKPRRKLG